jgi:SAM-dependent methyltransferase
MSPNDEATGGEAGDYRSVNRQGWDMLSLLDDPPPVDAASARATLDPFEWIPWERVSRVLCLAGGGGEQAPLFAALGYEVTVVDLSPGQLERDRQLAQELGLTIECVEADMLDLSPLGSRRFDLVYQPVSACYIPDVYRLYRQVATVTGAGGYYTVVHWTPGQLQLDAEAPWDGAAYRVVRPVWSEEPMPWLSDEAWNGERATCLHYSHSYGELVGGLCDAGFDIVGLREPEVGDPEATPNSESHLAAYFPPFIHILARRHGEQTG